MIKTIIIALFSALILPISAQVPVIEADVYVSDANDGWLGLLEMETANLVENTTVNLKGYTTPYDDEISTYQLRGSTWIKVDSGSGPVVLSYAEKNAIRLRAEANRGLQIADLNGVFKKANHLYLMNEASGAFIDRVGNVDLTTANLPAASAANAAFSTSRLFEEDTSDMGSSSANKVRDGAPFWVAIGVNFESLSATDGIAGEFEAGTYTYNWWLYRSSSTVNFKVRRKGTSADFDVVSITGISSGTDYTIIARADGTNLWLDVSGFPTAYDDNSLELGVENYHLHVGGGYISGTASSNFIDGEISYFAYGIGTLTEEEVVIILEAEVADWAAQPVKAAKIKKDRFTLSAWGDSLTTSVFATTPWVERAVTDAAWDSYELHGVGGQTSPLIRARMESYPASSHDRGCVALWMGNNNPTDPDVVVSDVQRSMEVARLSGADKTLILGLPNRSRVDATQEAIDVVTAQHLAINTRLSALADLHPDVYYLDLQTWFMTTGNYTSHTLTANDLIDIGKGIVPRGVRDTPASSSSTHLGDIGAQHLADLVSTYLD
tara:strand:+ start:1124 stop:2776 length:1653 start_codon:yes stop_codon:yes gene_type:complete